MRRRLEFILHRREFRRIRLEAEVVALELDLLRGGEADDAAEQRDREHGGAVAREREDADEHRADEAAAARHAHRARVAVALPEQRLHDAAAVEREHRDQVEEEQGPRDVVEEDHRQVDPRRGVGALVAGERPPDRTTDDAAGADVLALDHPAEVERIRNRQAEPLAAAHADERRQDGDEGDIHERAAEGGPEVRVRTLGRRARREAAEGPEEDLVGTAAHGAAGEAVTELVQQHDEEERGQSDRGRGEAERGVRPNARGAREHGEDERKEEEMDAHGDPRDAEHGERPRHRVVEGRLGAAPVAAEAGGPPLRRSVVPGAHGRPPVARSPRSFQSR